MYMNVYGQILDFQRAIAIEQLFLILYAEYS